MTPVATVARDFVLRRFPDATDAILAGSAARGEATPSSDVDLLVFGPEGMVPGDALAATYLEDGRLFEVFVYTEASFAAWARRGVEQARPVILQMLFEGIDLQASGRSARVRDAWRAEFERGPVIEQRVLDARRYAVTAWLDDTADAGDPAEAAVSASALFHGLAELLLVTNGRWVGAGKHLVRSLRAWNPARAERLITPFAAGDRLALVAVARVELDRLGGQLRGGHVR